MCNGSIALGAVILLTLRPVPPIVIDIDIEVNAH